MIPPITPAEAERQMDFAFAPAVMAARIRVRALNEPDEWSPSDHRRVEIEID
jgi:hypothetical protein